jgi:hypothetical protein
MLRSVGRTTFVHLVDVHVPLAPGVYIYRPITIRKLRLHAPPFPTVLFVNPDINPTV